eukprot:7341458-Prymnesium_polylepis.1
MASMASRAAFPGALSAPRWLAPDVSWAVAGVWLVARDGGDASFADEGAALWREVNGVSGAGAGSGALGREQHTIWKTAWALSTTRQALLRRALAHMVHGGLSRAFGSWRAMAAVRRAM